MAFINGKADPWGMKVNPSYKKLDLPRRRVAAARHLRPEDRAASAGRRTRTSTSTSSPRRSRRCARSPTALLDALAERADPLRHRHQHRPAHLQARPDRPAVLRLPLHARHRQPRRRGTATGCASAALETKTGTYVAPTNASLSAALKLSKQKDELRPVRARPGRRPQVAYGVPRHDGRLHRGPAAEPATRRTPPRWRSSSGSRRPRASARAAATASCPSGFLPIRKTGVTAQALRLRPGRRGRRRGAEGDARRRRRRRRPRTSGAGAAGRRRRRSAARRRAPDGRRAVGGRRARRRPPSAAAGGGHRCRPPGGRLRPRPVACCRC